MFSICSRCMVTFHGNHRKALPLIQLINNVATHQKSVNESGSLEPVPDLEYLLDKSNLKTIRENIQNRKGVGDIDLLHRVFETYKLQPDNSAVLEKLQNVALMIPNKSSPDTIIGKVPKVVKEYGQIQEGTKCQSFEQVCRNQGLLKFQSLSTSPLVLGSRSYMLLGDLARLERALVRWTLDKLIAKGWSYVSVPDLLPENLINACGFVTTGRQNQIYKLRHDQGGHCLAGTSEMSMAGLYAGRSMPDNKPIKMCTYSQCFRAEEAKNRVDKGFYRLHQFTKVEMFAVCTPTESEGLLQEIVDIQCELFSELELCYKLLEMPSEELGAAAYKKYDVEAWLHHLGHWGEISSASNCTDYQARRLSILTDDKQFAHTVNGTGCAVPRLLMAIIEQNQASNGYIKVPECLQPYLKLQHLRPNKDISSRLHFVRSRQSKYF